MTRDKNHLLYGIGENEYSARGLAMLGILYFGSLVSATFLGLAAYKLTLRLDPDMSSYFAQYSFARYFDRARWVSILIILPYLFASSRLTSFRAIGLARPFLRRFATWFACGLAMIALLFAGNAIGGAFRLNPQSTLAGLLARIDDALAVAFAVSIPEEIVFRGLVFRMFYSAMKPTPAILLSSAFFALLHLKPDAAAVGSIAPADIGFADSIALALGTMTAVVDKFDPAALLTIFLAGAALHQVFLLTDSLWANIGLHAGWVFALKLAGASFVATDSANRFTGTPQVIDGYTVSLILGTFALLLALLQRRKDLQQPAPHAA